MNELESLLGEVAQPDSGRIANATKALKENYYTKPECLPTLIQIMQHSQTVQIRQLAAVEARKQATAHWTSLDEGLCAQIRSSLLQSTLAEKEKLVRHASARVIANIARVDLPEGKWQDLPNFLVQAATSTSASDRVVGVYVLYTLFETLDSLFANKMQDLFQLFSTTIQDPESAEVRATTLLAIGRMAEIIDAADKQSVKAFRNVLPRMVEVLQETVTKDDSEHAKQAFETFQTLLILEPHLMSKHIPELLEFMMRIGSNRDVDEDYRNMALSWVMTCIRYRRNKIKSLKVGPMLVQAMLRVATEEDIDAPEEDCPSRLAYRCIDTLSTSLPPSHVYEPLLQSAQVMLQSQDIGERKAALICMGVGIEGAVDYVSQKLDVIFQAIVRGMEDPEAPVQRAALLALGQLADELPTEVAEQHAKLLPLVFNLMHSQGEKVGKSATSALEALLEGLDKKDILTYLPRLMSAFFAILHGNEVDLEARTTVVAAIGSAAHSAEEAFVQYLPDTMALLAPYLSLKGNTEEMEFRGVVTDTLGAIAGAIGKTHFAPYTQHVSQAAYEGLQLGQPRLRECGFVYFSVLARVLEQDFSPYVGMIVPALIQALQQDELGNDADGDVAGDLQAQEDGVRVEDIDLTGLNDEDDEDLMNSLGFNSAIAMEKEIAADALGELFAHVKQDFIPFLEQSCTELIKCLDHFYEGIRKSAVSSLFRVVATLYNMSSPQQWLPGVPAAVPLHQEVEKYAIIVRRAVLDILESEDEKLVATEVLRNMAETVKLCGPAVLGSQEDLNKICDSIMSVLQKQHPCQVGDEGGPFGGEDGEEDVIEMDDDGDSAEYDALLIDAANDLIVALSFALGGQFQQPFSMFLPLVIKFFSSKATTERGSAVACLGEVAGGLKTDITSFTEPIFAVLQEGLVDKDKEVRSNSAYAIGLLCEYTKTDLSSKYMSILQKLQPFFTEADNFRLSKDNAVGCTSRMIIARADAMPISQVLPVIVSNLPLTEDYAENQPVYKMICQLYRANNQDIMSLTEQLIPIFVSVLTGDKAQLNDTSREELTSLCIALNQQFPGTALQQALPIAS